VSSPFIPDSAGASVQCESKDRGHATSAALFRSEFGGGQTTHHFVTNVKLAEGGMALVNVRCGSYECEGRTRENRHREQAPFIPINEGNQ